MGFWQNVIEELEYQGKSRKYLASEANFDVSTIGTGLKRNGMPQADIALRIAKTLGVSVEYLVAGTDSSVPKSIKPEVLSLLTTVNHLSDSDFKFIKELAERLKK